MKSAVDGKALAAMLVCPHQWGEERATRLVDKGKPRDGKWSTCKLCGTHQIKWHGGTGTLYSPDALSTKPPEKTV